MGQFLLVFMPTVGLNSALQCFIEFEPVCDLLTELYMIMSLMGVFWYIGFLRWNSCFYVEIYLRMPKEITRVLLTLSQTESLLSTMWEKEELLITSNFSFSHSVFYPFGWAFCHFHQIWNCCLQTLSVWKSLKFVVWEWVKINVFIP